MALSDPKTKKRLHLPALLVCNLLGAVAHGEITLDGSLNPEMSGALSTQLDPATGLDDFRIGAEMGRREGGNLFHSFGVFNIGASQSATFTGPNAIENILGRVTGGSPSSIDGLLRSMIPGADLFLINPAGIMFGPNASLDVQGSFHVSTADYLKLGEEGRFAAAADPQESVLTSAPPSAFGFLGDNPPAAVSIDGTFLEVPDGQTLSIVAGDIQITDGALYAPSGQINIASAASKGEVTFNSTDPTLTLDFLDKLGNIDIRHTSSPRVQVDDIEIANVDTRGDAGGRIFIRGGEFVVDNASINATTLGEDDSRGIDIDVTGDITLTNNSLIRSSTRGGGNAGNTQINAGRLTLTDSSVFGSTFGAGRAGKVSVSAEDSVTVSGESFIASNSLERGDSGDRGDAGTVNISASNLRLDAGEIQTDTETVGQGGDILIDVARLSLSNSARIRAVTFNDGAAGDIQIQAEQVTISGGAQISSSSFSNRNLDPGTNSGPGGKLQVIATESILISGQDSRGFKSGLFSNTSSKGDAGSLSVSTPLLEINGGRIVSRTLGGGNATDIDLRTNRLVLTDGAQIFSGIGTIQFIDGVETIVGEKEGLGEGGDVKVDATGSIFISGVGNDGLPSGIFSNAQIGQGDAGNVYVDANSLNISDGGTISALNREGSSGNAGNIELAVGNITLNTGGDIRTDTNSAGQGGTISITAKEFVSISAFRFGAFSGLFSDTSGKGNAGNILVSTPVMKMNDGLVLAESNSDGNAGEIRLEVDRLVLTDGAQVRSGANGTGNGGTLTINAADAMIVSGRDEDGFQSALFSDTDGAGNAGVVSITTGQLVVDDGLINTSTSSSADAGTLKIDATEIEVHDGAEISASTNGTGTGGNLIITADNITLRDTGNILASSTTTGLDLTNDPDVARSGSISITARDSFRLSKGSSVSVETKEANAGPIDVEVGNLLHLREQASITTSAAGGKGNGGNITIDPTFVILEDMSAIRANAQEGRGGAINIQITGGGALFKSPDSVIDASAGPAGIDGSVEIDAPDTDISGSISTLPAAFFDASSVISNRCSARTAKDMSSFVMTGTGGVPLGPEYSSLSGYADRIAKDSGANAIHQQANSN